MSVDAQTVMQVAHLARLSITEEQAEQMQGELNVILQWVEQLNEVDVDGVEPMTAVVDVDMKKRQDRINAGARADDIVANAPASEDHFFVVPKVVE